MESIGLNGDCLYLILEQLDLPSLVNVAQVNAQFYYLTQNVFKRKFSHHIRVEHLENTPKSMANILIENTETFISHALGNHERLPSKSNVYSKYGEIDVIRDYQLLLNTLKYFGGVIQKFEMVRASLEPSVIKTICTYLDKYCASSLIQLNVGVTKEYWLDALKGPFKNLNEFTFDAGHEKVPRRSKTVSVSEKFPNLRRLSLNNYHRKKSAIYLNGQLPQLEYLSIANVDQSDNEFDKFLKENPSILSLEITGFPKNFISTIHRFLPNLENLTIGRHGFDGYIEIDEPIHFENLNVFHLRSYDPRTLTKISFSHLQELLMYYENDEVNKWIEFFKMNHTFTRFHIYEETHLDDIDSKMLNLINELPESVVDISIVSYSGLEPETIAQIIESRENLMKFQLTTVRELADIEAVSRDRLTTNYDIEISNDHYAWNFILFVRKNSTSAE